MTVPANTVKISRIHREDDDEKETKKHTKLFARTLEGASANTIESHATGNCPNTEVCNSPLVGPRPIKCGARPSFPEEAQDVDART